MMSLLLPCATTELSLITMWCLIGATPRGQPWTPAVTLPPGCDGLSARRMALLWTFREPSRCRHVHRELLRNAVLDLTPIIPTTACHQRNYVERYSRSMTAAITARQPPRPWSRWGLIHTWPQAASDTIPQRRRGRSHLSPRRSAWRRKCGHPQDEPCTPGVK